MASEGPIILAGCMGSGSTLLRLMLDSHEDIAIPQETGFLRVALAYKHVPFWAFGRRWYTRLELTEDELMQHVGQSFDALFRRYAERHGATRWGDKTPFNTWHLPMALEMFPDAALVGIIRHPGAVMASLKHRFGFDWAKGAHYWVRETTKLVQQSMDLGDRITLVRYEDLCLQQEQVMRELLTSLGMPWSDAVLTHHEVQAQRADKVLAEGNTRVDQPVDLRRISRWVESFDEEAWAELRKEAPALAEFLGYRVDDATDLAQWSTTGVLLSGAELKRRRQKSPGTVDWSWQPPPHIGNHPIARLGLSKRRKPTRLQRTAWRDATTEQPASMPAGMRTVYERLPESVRRRAYRARRKLARRIMGKSKKAKKAPTTAT